MNSVYDMIQARLKVGSEKPTTLNLYFGQSGDRNTDYRNYPRGFDWRVRQWKKIPLLTRRPEEGSLE